MEWWWPSQCVGCDTEGEGRLCRGCRAVAPVRLQLAVPGLAAAWTCDRYDGGLGQALRRAKARGDLPTAHALAGVFARRLHPVLRAVPPDVIVPAPSSARSRVQRGFSAAAVLAHALGEALDVPVTHALFRHGGRRQATLDRGARARNLRGRVRCETSPGRLVLVVDDVVTTGATLDACTRELLGAGSAMVAAATLCAAFRRDDDVWAPHPVAR